MQHENPGLTEAEGEVSGWSHPISMNSIVTFAGDGKLEQDELFGVTQVSHYCLLNLDFNYLSIAEMSSFFWRADRGKTWLKKQTNGTTRFTFDGFYNKNKVEE